MNFNAIRKFSPALAAGAGLLGILLRAALYRTGFDDRGILSDSHPLHLMSLGLTAAVTIYLVWNSFQTQSEDQDRPLVRFLLGLLGSYFLLIHTVTLFSRTMGLLELARFALALFSAIAAAVFVLPFGTHRRMRLVCLGVIIVGFGLDMLCRYRTWSGNPQLPDYFFHLLGGVMLSLGSYHTLALDTGLGKPRIQRFCCNMALFLCLLSLIGPDPWEFYLGGALWASVCALTPAPPTQEIREEETDVPA